MSRTLQIKWFFIVVVSLTFSGSLHAQIQNRDQIARMARMARAKSTAQLMVEQRMAGDDYRVQIVSAARQLELVQSDKRSAVALLELIPKNDVQKAVWMTFGDSLCDVESISDMKSLGRLGDRLPHDLAMAVILIPEKMYEYVAYANQATQDPHNDYAMQMKTVCRINHEGFTKAIEELPEGQRDWFVKHIVNPDGCHTLALPEAD
ncbi:MAG: hypothetical protein ABR987_01450 [Terracidiphilus sp.]|jgi:hypothetical protein